MRLGGVFAIATVLFASGYVVSGSGIPAGQRRETTDIRYSFVQVGRGVPPVQKRALFEWDSFSSAIVLERRDDNTKTSKLSVARLGLTQEVNEKLKEIASRTTTPSKSERVQEAEAVLHEAHAKLTRTVIEEYPEEPQNSMSHLKRFESMIEWPPELGPKRTPNQHVVPHQLPEIARLVSSKAKRQLVEIVEQYNEIPQYDYRRGALIKRAHQVADTAISKFTTAVVASDSLYYVNLPGDVQRRMEWPHQLFGEPHTMDIAP
jgi:hypothetical protein